MNGKESKKIKKKVKKSRKKFVGSKISFTFVTQSSNGAHSINPRQAAQIKRKMKNLYFANFKTSNGTRFSAPIRSYNKKTLASVVADIAAGNTPLGSECNWTVWTNRDGRDYIVFAGYIKSNGVRRRAHYLEGCLYW